MARVTTAALGTDPAMTEASTGILVKGGSSVDACIAGFFAAAGQYPGVLLGSNMLLVAGTGAGVHLFDGSVLQPGRGAPRPRGFREQEAIPNAALVPIPTTGAFLAAAHAHGGSVPMSELATPGVRIARAKRALGRANLLRRVGAAGPVAFRDESFVRGLLAVAGRAEGGNVTREDMAEAKARVVQPALDGDLVRIESESDDNPWPQLETAALVACDHQGVLSVLHCTYNSDGVDVEPHEVTACKLAVAVRRGVPRISPGSRRSMPVPVALLTERGVPWAAVAFKGAFAVDWERLVRGIRPGITLDQSLRDLLSYAGPARRVLAIVRATSGDAPPRSFELSS